MQNARPARSYLGLEPGTRPKDTGIPQTIRRHAKNRQLSIIEERSQGFLMEDDVKSTLDRIRLRANRMKTMPLANYNHEFEPVESIFERSSTRRKTTLGKYGGSARKPTAQQQSILPELHELIRTRERETSTLTRAKRRKIIHLLILGLNRRNLGKLYEALDIILLASFYFEKDEEERHLRTICLSLISKIHKEIRQKNLCLNSKKTWLRKRKSLTLANYHNKSSFMEDFLLKVRKSKLLGEFSYADSRTQKGNRKRINARCDVLVPEPSEIFDQLEGVLNYEYVAVTVDDYTSMFPYEYPKSLHEKISISQYRQMIGKLNGLLLPESKCYSFESIVKIFYLPFLMIFLVLACFTTLRMLLADEPARVTLIVSALALLSLFCYKISSEESGYTNYIEIREIMRRYLFEWEEEYSAQNIKFKMGDNMDAIFIVFPSDKADSATHSSRLTEIKEDDCEYNTEQQGDSKASKRVTIVENSGSSSEQHDDRYAPSRFAPEATREGQPEARPRSQLADQKGGDLKKSALKPRKVAIREAVTGFQPDVKDEKGTQFLQSGAKLTPRLRAQNQLSTIYEQEIYYKLSKK